MIETQTHWNGMVLRHYMLLLLNIIDMLPAYVSMDLRWGYKIRSPNKKAWDRLPCQWMWGWADRWNNKNEKKIQRTLILRGLNRCACHTLRLPLKNETHACYFTCSGSFVIGLEAYLCLLGKTLEYRFWELYNDNNNVNIVRVKVKTDMAYIRTCLCNKSTVRFIT